MTNRKNQKGFTLIELSIVLILIGLIIGGVLKGQELISSTRLKMTVSQWDAVKAAVNTFQDKYVALPGDYSESRKYLDNDAGYPQGDGNGIIGSTVSTYNGVLGDENKGAWQHLYDANLLATIDTTNDTLAARIAGSNFHILYGTFGATGKTRTSHWLRLQNGAIATTAPATSPLSPKEAVEVDRKFDDEILDEGIIQAGKVGGSGDCDNTNAFSNEKVCTLVFELF